MLTDSHPHDLVITLPDGGLQVVSDLNLNAMLLHFTVLFPWGDKGWDPEATYEKANLQFSSNYVIRNLTAVR